MTAYSDKNSNGATPPEILNSVVKVICTHSDPDYSLPWQRKPLKTSTSSAFLIKGRFILTNAHSVENYHNVKIKKRCSDKKFRAKVLSIGHEYDLALLTVEPEEFWDGLSYLKIGREPKLQESVSIIGFPIGGSNVSVTAGVVSRVEMQQYSHSSCELLCIQIDAAINSGNSGGPALDHEWNCVGIAFQSLFASDAENIGYIIPWEVVDHFLNEYQRSLAKKNSAGLLNYNNQAEEDHIGSPTCGFEWQCMESATLRRFKGMGKTDSGILVKELYPTSDAFGKLKIGDIITHFDGVSIANDGTIQFRNGERIMFSYLKTSKYIGDQCQLTILRDGQPMKVNLILNPNQANLLVPLFDTQKTPNYLIYGGFVIVELSNPYLISEYGEDYEHKAEVRLLDKTFHSKKESLDERILLLSHVLNHDVNEGYEQFRNVPILKCNGVKPKNLQDLANILDKSNEKYAIFDLEHKEIAVLDAKKVKKAKDEILAQHGIHKDRHFATLNQLSIDNDDKTPVLNPNKKKKN